MVSITSRRQSSQDTIGINYKWGEPPSEMPESLETSSRKELADYFRLSIPLLDG